jgi:hypothetical protein
MNTMDLHLTQHTYLPWVMYKRYYNDTTYHMSRSYPRDNCRSNVPRNRKPTPAWAQGGTQPQPGIALGASTQTPSSSRRAGPSRPVTCSS